MESYDLAQSQALPLDLKIEKSIRRIREWHEHWRGQVYVSFSGGKDSTVLLHLVRSVYPDTPAVFCDTGLEYPEIREFVKTFDNVTLIHPAKNFRDVIRDEGYPVISKEQSRYIMEIRGTKSAVLKDTRLHGKLFGDGHRGRMGKLSEKWKYLLDAPFRISHKCCDVMKKRPFSRYAKESGRCCMTGEMASDSRRRKSMYMMRGCNGFDMKHPKSTPLGFWTEQDVLRYLKEFSVPCCSVYGGIAESGGKLRTAGAERTGCMFCMFGVHMESGENRFMRMQRTHPKLWDYCIHTLGIGRVLNYIGIPYSSIFADEEANADA